MPEKGRGLHLSGLSLSMRKTCSLKSGRKVKKEACARASSFLACPALPSFARLQGRSGSFFCCLAGQGRVGWVSGAAPPPLSL